MSFSHNDTNSLLKIFAIIFKIKYFHFYNYIYMIIHIIYYVIFIVNEKNVEKAIFLLHCVLYLTICLMIGQCI